ncbi:MAG: hypothetical protein KF833_18215 [Verrucomicrobiae bacterium]|nr:hypothetical protein [Verrucomicrobiae bacterium]
MDHLPRRRLPVRVPIEAARQQLTRERFSVRLARALAGWIASTVRGSGLDRSLAGRGFERVHLPCCWVEIEPAPTAPLAVLVDGFARTAQVVHREALETASPEAGTPEFGYPLDAGATVELARQAILMARLGRRLHGTGVPASPAALHPTAFLSYPYEVLHFPRGRRRDFRMFDLVTGRPAGPLVRLAFVQALRQAAKPDGSVSDVTRWR